MGRLVAELSDVSIVTSDNPRTESPGEIIRQIEGGLLSGSARIVKQEDLERGLEIRGYLKIEDRRDAIGLAIRTARAGDLVLIAGKGHENYQILGDRRVPFDDRDEVRKALRLTPRQGFREAWRTDSN
jgi:UDP-N-acetylmuramyl tripeptide synthase